MSMKNPSDTIWNLTRDLPACSTVPQPTAPLRTPHQRVRYLVWNVRITSYYVTCSRIAGCVFSRPLRLEEQKWREQLGNIAYCMVATLLRFQMANPTGLETQCHRLKDGGGMHWLKSCLLGQSSSCLYSPRGRPPLYASKKWLLFCIAECWAARLRVSTLRYNL
jgi:hypothetical protein